MVTSWGIGQTLGNTGLLQRSPVSMLSGELISGDMLNDQSPNLADTESYQ
jgi:hypothetical protein